MLVPQMMLVPHTMFEAFNVAVVPHTTLVPQMMFVPHTMLFVDTTEPDITLPPQMTCCPQGYVVLPIFEAGVTPSESHHDPVRASVSTARARSIAPAALISPAPCVR